MTRDARALSALLDPASVAVVGASPDLAKPGGRCLAFLRKYGYGGRIYPINPRYPAIGDLDCYPDLRSLPAPVDLVVLLVPAPSVADYLRDAAEAGARAAIVCSSGFAEGGAEGERLQRELVDAAGEAGLAVLGPNCLGLVDLHRHLVASFSTALEGDFDPRPGPIAFVTQSGAMGIAVFSLAQREGIGVGKFISTGNEAVLDFTDFVEHLIGDADVSVILGYLEGVRDGRRLVDAARRARAAGKQVAVLKVGRSEAGGRAARSHTGALAGSAEVYDAAFRRGGVLAVGDVTTLLDLAVALPGHRRARGPRVGIVSMSGGAGVMMADACSARGLRVVRLGESTRDALARVLPPFVSRDNPVDYGPVYGDVEAIEACVDTTAGDPAIDLLLVFVGLSPGMSGVIEQRLAGVQPRRPKPVVVAWLGGPQAGIDRLRSLGVAAYGDPARAVEVAVQLARAGSPLPSIDAPHASAATPRGEATRQGLRSVLASGRTSLSEREVKSLLAPYAIPMIPEAAARSGEEARRAALAFGCPVAVKAESPELLHKTDAGAVRLGVAPEDAASAYQEVVDAASRVVGRDAVRGAVVQPMAREGVEILVGARFDAQFGASITVGLGGVTSEVLADVATELAPLDLDLAASMIDRLRGARLLDPFRGAPARDRESLAGVLVSLSEFAMDAGPLLAELDLNPVIVHARGAGCTVVDAAAVLGE